MLVFPFSSSSVVVVVVTRAWPSSPVLVYPIHTCEHAKTLFPVCLPFPNLPSRPISSNISFSRLLVFLLKPPISQTQFQGFHPPARPSISLVFFANPSSLQVILKVLGNKLGLDLRFLLLLLHLSTSQTTQTNRQLSPFSLFSLAISAIPQFFSTSLLASAALTPIHNDSIESSISNSTLDSQILNDPLSHNPS